MLSGQLEPPFPRRREGNRNRYSFALRPREGDLKTKDNWILG